MVRAVFGFCQIWHNELLGLGGNYIFGKGRVGMDSYLSLISNLIT